MTTDAASPNRADESAPPGGPSPRRKRWWRRLSPTARLVLACVAAMLLGAVVLSQWSHDKYTTGAVLGIPALIIVLVGLVRLALPRSTIATIVAALLTYSSYLSYTGSGERNYDGGEQLKYIKYIVEHWAIPPADHCFICHHPPAYYTLAAASYRFCELTHIALPNQGAQFVATASMFAVVVFAALTVRRFSSRPWVITLATALVAFWPYTILQTGRVHNDPMVCALIAAGLYFLLRWYQDDRNRDLWIAVALSFASLFTKTNGVILVASIGLVFGYRLLFQSGRMKLLRRAAPGMLALILALGVFAVLHGRGDRDSTDARLLGTAADVDPRGFMGNEPLHYLYFDYKIHVTQPYALAHRNEAGRHYYWNHLLKSSLFATHNTSPDVETSYAYNTRIAEVMNVMLLMLIAFCLCGFGVARRDGFMKRYAVPVISSVCFIGAHIAFRARVPSSHHGDFRFVYPILIACSLCYALTAEAFWERRLLLVKVGKLLAWIFVALSAIYFIPKAKLVKRYLPPCYNRIPERNVVKVRGDRTPWDAPGVILIRFDEVLEILLSNPRTVEHLDVSLDFNDTYELELVGDDETRRIQVGPRKPDQAADEDAEMTTEAAAPAATSSESEEAKKKPFSGLARYQVDVDPPMKKVRVVRVRGIRGDRAYSLGHLLFTQPKRTLSTPQIKRGVRR